MVCLLKMSKKLCMWLQKDWCSQCNTKQLWSCWLKLNNILIWQKYYWAVERGIWTDWQIAWEWRKNDIYWILILTFQIDARPLPERFWTPFNQHKSCTNISQATWQIRGDNRQLRPKQQSLACLLWLSIYSVSSNTSKCLHQCSRRKDNASVSNTNTNGLLHHMLTRPWANAQCMISCLPSIMY